MSVYSNKAHNKWDEPASSALALCLFFGQLVWTWLWPVCPPLARIRRLHLMLYAHASFRQRYSDMSCQSPKQCYFLPGFFSAKLGNLPFSERLYPGTKIKRGGRPSTSRDRAGAWQERYRKPYNRRLARRSKKIVKAKGIHHEGKCSSGSYQFKGKTG